MSVKLLAAVTLASVLAGCAAATSPSPSANPTAGARPSSPAVVLIVAPTSGSALAGPTVHVAISLTGARVVPATTTTITPTEGHIHLYVNGGLVSMNYGLDQDLSLASGTYVLKAEFVAADHAPFNPRVWSDQIYFTVK